MLGENEVAALMEDQEVLDATLRLKTEFITSEAQFLDISDDDFISLVFLAPSIGVALANGTISLFEELTINKKARRLSKGSYFLKKDPVVHASQFLIKNFVKWENAFYKLIKLTIFSTFRKSPIILEALRNKDASTNDMRKDIMNAPYILVKIIAFLFADDESDLMASRSISQVEYDKIVEIGEKLDIHNLPIFQTFCQTFIIR